MFERILNLPQILLTKQFQDIKSKNSFKVDLTETTRLSAFQYIDPFRKTEILISKTTF